MLVKKNKTYRDEDIIRDCMSDKRFLLEFSLAIMMTLKEKLAVDNMNRNHVPDE